MSDTLEAEELTRALALLHQMRQQEAQLVRTAARRLTDPRHDAVQVSIDTAQAVQQLRTEAVRQIMGIGARLPDDNTFMGTQTRDAPFTIPPLPVRPTDDTPPWVCHHCGYQMTRDAAGKAATDGRPITCPQCQQPEGANEGATDERSDT